MPLLVAQRNSHGVAALYHHNFAVNLSSSSSSISSSSSSPSESAIFNSGGFHYNNNNNNFNHDINAIKKSLIEPLDMSRHKQPFYDDSPPPPPLPPSLLTASYDGSKKQKSRESPQKEQGKFEFNTLFFFLLSTSVS